MSQNERKRVEFYVHPDSEKVHRKVTKDLGGVTVVTSDVPIANDIDSFRKTYPQVTVNGDRQSERSLSELLSEASPEELQALGLERSRPSYPIAGKNGWWKLSNGEKFRGDEKAALAEQAEIDDALIRSNAVEVDVDEAELERLTAPGSEE